MPTTKRKSTYDVSDPFVASDSGSPPPSKSAGLPRPNKRVKPSTTSSSKIPQKQKDSDGNPYWSISTARRVTVSDFKGKKMISVREYYSKDDVWLPGKKGITMTLDQYTEFVKVLPEIEKALGKDGEKVGRPDYSDQRGGNDYDDDDGLDEDGVEENSDDDDGDVRKKNGGGKNHKSNIEATSDEDED